ncbi:urocanate hydratase, partial [Lactobacillus crispatus]
MANGNIVGEWSQEESRRKLDAMGLTIMPGMTAAAWQYIGSQGILQGTYETFMATAREHFGGPLAGRLLLTSGCGGMSGAQPLAGKLAGASTLVIEVDQARIDRRIASGYCDATTDNLE